MAVVMKAILETGKFMGRPLQDDARGAGSADTGTSAHYLTQPEAEWLRWRQEKRSVPRRRRVTVWVHAEGRFAVKTGIRIAFDPGLPFLHSEAPRIAAPLQSRPAAHPGETAWRGN